MSKKLQQAVQEFLLQYNISADTKLFDDLIFEMAGIKLLASSESDYGFFNEMGMYHRGEAVIQVTKFHVPLLNLAELNLLLTFLEVPQEKYLVGEEINVSEKTIFKKLIPLFKDKVKTLMETTPEFLKPYVVESKPKLERTAIDRVKKSLETVIVNYVGVEHDSADASQLATYLHTLDSFIHRLEKNPAYYKCINTMNDSLIELTSRNEVMRAQLVTLLEDLALYTKYNRSESAIGVKLFHQAIESFLPPLDIDSGECDVIEHTILKLAGITMFPMVCQFEPSYKQTHLEFKFKGMDEATAQQLVHYFQSLGDDTAKMSPSYWAEDSMPTQQCALLHKRSSGSPKKPSVYAVEIDGKFAHEILLPLIQANILSMTTSSSKNDRDAIAGYRKQSQQQKTDETPMDMLQGGAASSKRKRGGAMFFAHQSSSSEDSADNTDADEQAMKAT